MARTEVRTPVLIVGGGPVGLSLAMDLAWRGVECTLAELRPAGEPPAVKCNHVSSRSMEALRRLGIAALVRDAGLPPDWPVDVAWSTTVIGTEIGRIEIPCRRDRFSDGSSPDALWPTPEPPHRVNQLFLEPILFQHVVTLPEVTLLNRVWVDDVTQHEESVVAHGIDLDAEEEVIIHARYLVGCDGGRSTIRKAIGVTLTGTPEISRALSTFIRAPELVRLIKRKKAWFNHAANPRRTGNAVALDGRELWLVHCWLRPGEHDFEEIDRDRAIREVLGVAPEFEYEVLAIEDWVARRLVADRFCVGRVFLCGDSAHIWIPVAGYGMNAGIADALGLSWQLAAVIRGWAPDELLASYEAERRPITEQVSKFAMNLGIKVRHQADTVDASIEASGPEGNAFRESYGRQLVELNRAQYFCAGLNFGYFYDASPTIYYDGEQPPAFTMDTYTPSTVPGCRTPHLWLDDGRSLYDALGAEFTLLRMDPHVDVSGLLEAAVRREVPLAVLDVKSTEAEALYREKLVLSRPDRHVAWRGDREPEDPGELIDLVRGARMV